jgi:hypothetical protein
LEKQSGRRAAMPADQESTILVVVEESEAAEESTEGTTLSSVRVPTEAIKRSLERFLSNFSEIIQVVRQNTAGVTVE